MSGLTLNWPDLLAGFLLGSVFGVVFEDELKRRWRGVLSDAGRRVKLWRTGDVRSGEFFWCFGRQTKLFVIDGSSDLAYSPEGIRLTLVTPPSLPPIVEERRQAELRHLESGAADWWNGEQLGVCGYTVRRNGDETELALSLRAYRHDYATFRATTCALVQGESFPGELALEQQLIAATAVGQPATPLASGLGVFTVAISKDGLIFSGQRSSSSGVRPGQRDFGICEAVHPVLDNTGSGAIDLFNTARRGVKEEVVGDDVVFDDVRLIGFALDVPWQQFALIAYVRLGIDADEVVRRRSRGAAGKWELGSIRFDPPEQVFAMMSREQTWDLGILANYMTACQLQGKVKAKTWIGAD